MAGNGRGGGLGAVMDAVAIGAVISAVASGAAGEAGSRLWDGLAGLVRRPFTHRAGSSAGPAAVADGVAELAAAGLPGAGEARALDLARVLVVRAEADPVFGGELARWVDRARSAVEAGGVANVVSGGVQYGPVLQGRDFSGLTFGASPPPQRD